MEICSIIIRARAISSALLRPRRLEPRTPTRHLFLSFLARAQGG
jgi:hypothetical protein